MHIQEMIQQRDALVARAMPPETLFEFTYADQDVIRLGARLNQTYAAALAVGRKGDYSAILERAKHAVEDYLAHFPPDRRRAIVRGALVSVYGAETPAADTAVWLARANGDQDSTQPGIGSSSVASLTIEALREIGLLDEIIATKEGLVIYPIELSRSARRE